MNPRIFLLLIATLLLAMYSGGRAEPKAYELVKYQGKAAGVTIAFDFADGYPEASEIKVVTGGKTTKFRLNNSGKMEFAPEKDGGAVKSVTLKMDLNDRAPATVAGSYVAEGKTVSFTLKQGK
jgi:hypothetical protein